MCRKILDQLLYTLGDDYHYDVEVIPLKKYHTDSSRTESQTTSNAQSAINSPQKFQKNCERVEKIFMPTIQNRRVNLRVSSGAKNLFSHYAKDETKSAKDTINLSAVIIIAHTRGLCDSIYPFLFNTEKFACPIVLLSEYNQYFFDMDLWTCIKHLSCQSKDNIHFYHTGLLCPESPRRSLLRRHGTNQQLAQLLGGDLLSSLDSLFKDPARNSQLVAHGQMVTALSKNWKADYRTLRNSELAALNENSHPKGIFMNSARPAKQCDHLSLRVLIDQGFQASDPSAKIATTYFVDYFSYLDFINFARNVISGRISLN